MTALTITSFILGAISLVITAYGVWVALRSRNRRRLGWEVRTSPMISGDARLRGELDIRFHGETVADPHAVIVEIRNTGDAALRADDFVDPISVRFEPGAYWMMAVIVADPDERRIPFEKEGGVVYFRPELLQPAESVYVHGLFEGEPGKAVASARVAGLAGLEPLRRKPTVTELLGRGVLEAVRSITSVSVIGVTIDTTRRRKQR